MLSEKTIKELQNILKDYYGRDLSLKEASILANGLVGYFDLLAKLNFKIEGIDERESS